MTTEVDSDSGAKFGEFLQAVASRASWKNVKWPPHASERIQLAHEGAPVPLETQVLGAGQYCVVVQLTLPGPVSYSVAVKFMSIDAPRKEHEFIQREVGTEATILRQIERDFHGDGDSDRHRHIGMFFESVDLGPGPKGGGVMLLLEPYSHYSPSLYLVRGDWHSGVFNAAWLECVRQMLFQVFYTLAQLQATYPLFRHNDLLDTNVLVTLLPDHEIRSVPYTLQYPSQYIIPRACVDVKIIDFANANANSPGLRNRQVHDMHYIDFDITTLECPLYDVHLLFLCVLSRANNRAFEQSSYGRELLAFINDIIPMHYFQRSSGFLNTNTRLSLHGQRCLNVDPAVVYSTPADILQHPFFSAYVGAGVHVQFIAPPHLSYPSGCELECDESMSLSPVDDVTMSGNESGTENGNAVEEAAAAAAAEAVVEPPLVVDALVPLNAYAFDPMLV